MKLENIAKKYNYICHWCDRKYNLCDLSRDHIVPINKSFRGGGNSKHGACVLSCKVCNAKRGNMDFDYCNIHKKKFFKNN